MTERTLSLNLTQAPSQLEQQELGTLTGNRQKEALLADIKQLPANQKLLVEFDGVICQHNLIERFLQTIKPSFIVAMILQCLDMIRYGLLLQRADAQRHRRRLQYTLWLQPNAKQKWAAYVNQQPDNWFNLAILRQLQLTHSGQFQLYSTSPDWIVTPVLARFEKTLAHESSALSVMGDQELAKAQPNFDVLIAGSSLLPPQLASMPTKLLLDDAYGISCEAGQLPMLPFVYTKKVKRPNESYFTRAVIGHDYLTLVLVFALASPEPLLCAASLLLFVLAYFSAYEIGYFENDRLGLCFEAKPKVSQNYRMFAQYFKPAAAWGFALILAVPASLLATQVSNISLSFMEGHQFSEWWKIWLVFVAFMATVRLVFAWFNRIHEKGRIVPMLLLQLARTSGYLCLFSTSLIGVLFCLSHGLSKWFPYVVYRFGGSRRGMPNHLINMFLLTLMLASMAVGPNGDLTDVLSAHGLLIISYAALRALKDIWSFRHEMALLRKINK
ncbi:hypothetical protein K0504_10470 [Neiella marina]|uniref:Uncharacterized protein n=1 Tax=Neiella holothuriorum TaxID=2870530 RepID=A0ABS7EGQ4_9GAMM|nr:hypothetical protein [Neiella holothuriorum]MBW8191460.1 hypothetical protein [Neiella holothuriorum]